MVLPVAASSPPAEKISIISSGSMPSSAPTFAVVVLLGTATQQADHTSDRSLDLINPYISIDLTVYHTSRERIRRASTS